MEQRGTHARGVNQIFDALSHPYRRRILSLLAEANPRDVADFSPDDIVVEAEDTELQTVALYHTHLPKLADAGYTEWDRDTHTILRGPRFDEVAPLIRLVRDHQDELPHGWP